ncbi:unnamed protein product [Meganyctiphanes norvegica]|uniref:Alpha N-terminal protein methyltransferase 1 n=2 Tax=Meganyctiphanes norvegica TaxID=48144 RepID=A0AAV2QSX0_MEGNR
METLSVDENASNEKIKDAIKAQETPEFYSDAQKYWDNIPATNDGMLGGFAHISKLDVGGSDTFLKLIFKMKNPPGHSRAVDCGAGIGRITKHLLSRHFGKVDIVEQCQNFVDQAKEALKGHKKVGEFYCQGLQDFNPPSDTYDVVWSQWVLGHLTDSHLEDFFRRMGAALKPNGVIVVKENVSSSGEVELDEEDSSVTRPEKLLLQIMDQAGLRVLKNTKQNKMPNGLYEVRMICLRPKSADSSNGTTV